MKQLTGLDASFLYMETQETYGHVNGLAIYQRPHENYDPYTVVRQRFELMTGHLEPLRRRLAEVPFGLDHPYWIDDPNFDISYHVRQIGLVSDRELVPDLEHLIDLHIAEVDDLFAATGAEWAVPPDPDDPRRRSSKRPGKSAIKPKPKAKRQPAPTKK